MTKRPTDGIRRLCGLVNGMRDNEFAEATVRKAAVAEECDRLDETVEAVRQDAWDEGFEAGREWSIEDCEAIAWVREHGGLESVEARLMPEGMSWPVFEDSEPVRIGDVVSDVEVRSVVFRDGGILLSDCTSVPGWGTWRSYKEPIKRPAPKVLDADGVEVEVGDDLYSVEGMLKFHVSAIDKKSGRIATEAMFALDKWADPKMYTHRAPVLAADGEPLREGETVWHKQTGRSATVKGFDRMLGEPCAVIDFAGIEQRVSGKLLTHERPVLDADGVPIREGDTVYVPGFDEPLTVIEPPTQCPYYHSDRHYCSIHDVPATSQKVAEEMFGKMCHSTKEEADAYDAMLKSKSVEIHPVDREALLALAGEMQGYADGAASGDGFPYVNAGSLWSYADRIREACGVVDAG